MNERVPDAARRAVEVLASSVDVPAFPDGLRAGTSRRWLAPGLLGAALILGAAAVMIWQDGEDPPSRDRASGVVVEHLRVGGKPVPTRIRTIPGSGAVVVMALEEHADTGPSSRDAALALSAGWVRCP